MKLRNCNEKITTYDSQKINIKRQSDQSQILSKYNYSDVQFSD